MVLAEAVARDVATVLPEGKCDDSEGKCDEQDWPSSGCKPFYINLRAMIWQLDHAREERESPVA